MLECVVNISTGRDPGLVAAIARRAGASCLDHQSDPWHNRSVLTLAGPDAYEASLEVARATIACVDFTRHDGVHPAIGALDVVPFTPLGPDGYGPEIDLTEAIAARDAFIKTIANELALPCFAYGPERTLPSIRRDAFGTLDPTSGPLAPHPTAGGCCVGARPTLIAYNVYLDADITVARRIARSIRSHEIRALGLVVGDEVQVSCNLVEPWAVGPAAVVDLIAAQASVRHTELIGLVPDALLRSIPRSRWAELDLSVDRTIEARLDR
jgi:glutamate formiminotransferase